MVFPMNKHVLRSVQFEVPEEMPEVGKQFDEGNEF